jgi:hypothetical protein
MDTCGKCGSGGLGSLGLAALCQIPWQQIGDAADGVLGDAGEHGSEIVLRVDSVELGRTDERVDGSGALAAGVGSGEKIVLAAQGDSPDILPMSVRN